MPQSSQNRLQDRTRHAPRDVVVRSWRLLDRGAGPRMILAAGVLLAWLAGALSRSPATGVVIGGLIMLSCWRIWLPVHFEIGPSGVTERIFGRERRTTWSSIERVERRTWGLVLLANPQRGPLGRLSSVCIPYGGQKAALVTIFDFYRMKNAHV